MPKHINPINTQPSLTKGLSHNSDYRSHSNESKPSEQSQSSFEEYRQSQEDVPSDEESSSQCSSSSVSEMGSQETLLASNCWGSGNSTERSSVDSTYSWTNDEFDWHAARNVDLLFNEIDSILYEGSNTGPEYAFNECNDWLDKFPHLRVLGSQLQPPKDCGFVAIQKTDSETVASPHIESVLSDVDRELDAVLGNDYVTNTVTTSTLAVTGQSITPKQPPTKLPKELMYLVEETFAQEGYYEEVYAIDSTDESVESLLPGRQKTFVSHWKSKGYPPVTPLACLQDTVMSNLFDYIWQEIFDWSGDLIKKYSDTLLDNSVDGVSIIQQISNLDELTNPDYLLTSKTLSSPSSSSEPKQASLDNVLTVSRKKLVLREKSNIQLSDTPETLSPTRPMSIASHPRPLRPPSIQRDLSDHLMIVRRGPLHSQRSTAGVRLAPLTAHMLDRSRTPSVEDTRSQQMQNEVVIGHRLSTGPDELTSPSPPIFPARHSTLPPLEATISKRNVQNRASSALVSDKETRVSYKDRYLHLHEPVNRPSTTHAFRSDTPLGSLSSRRSSTPMGIYTVTARNARNKYLGVTGSGIQPHSDIDEIVQEDKKDAVQISSPALHQQWTPMTAAPRNNRYGRGKLLTSYLRV